MTDVETAEAAYERDLAEERQQDAETEERAEAALERDAAEAKRAEAAWA